MALRLEFSRMMSARVPSGVTAAEWRDLGARFAGVHATVAADEARGRYGFVELEAQATAEAEVRAWAESVRGRFDDVVVLGIGGSALGAIALRTALARPGQVPRLHVLDNVDPRPIAALLSQIDLSRALFCVISKSGTTVETLAQYALVRERLESGGLAPRDHFALVTDPAAGPLRALARDERLSAFDIPANVGGRFSVLTPVGTLPAVLAGFDTAALLAGAREMRDRCASSELAKNPAGVFATLQWRAQQTAGQGLHVMMSYSDALRDVAPWFAQLWAESLGKVDADGLHVGPTPIAARGATDQHSQLQLYMEGPPDKTVAFLVEGTHDDDLRLAAAAAVPDAAAFMRGRSLGELLIAEQRATADALASAGRPSLTIEVDRADAHHLGALFMLFMRATIFAGILYRVNPIDQPGVELGKRLTREAMAAGRAGGAGRDVSPSQWTV